MVETPRSSFTHDRQKGRVIEMKTVTRFASKNCIFHIEKEVSGDIYTITNEKTGSCVKYTPEEVIRFMAGLIETMAEAA